MNRPYLYILFLLLLPLCGWSQIITTFAGNGSQGYSGDGGQASAATLYVPNGVASDNTGNVYISDFHNNRIRKVNASGKITTYAGGTGYGYNGDEIPATAALLNAPWGVAADAAGNLYIADAENNRIRLVTTDGIIHTVAGTGTFGYSGDGYAATLAQISKPAGVAVDGKGDIFFTDPFNNCVRQVSAAGIISTCAGNGNLTGSFSGDGGPATTAALGSPTGIAVDGTGNLYIADEGNNRIRMVNAAGIISTFAGNGGYGYDGDGAAAISATLAAPNGVAADATGNIYIADNANNRVRKVNTSGIIVTLAGDGASGYGGDGGPPTAATLYAPWGINVDGESNVYIADAENSRVRIITCFSTAAPAIHGDTVFCAGSTIVLSDSAAGGEWQVSDAAVATIDSNSGLVTGLNQGTTTATYTAPPNMYGCTSSATFALQVIPHFVVNATVTNVRCYGLNDGSITTQVDAGGSYHYLWSTGDVSPADDSLAPGMYTLKIWDTPLNCTVYDTFAINQPDSFMCAPVIGNDVCKLGLGNILLSPSGGIPPYSIAWSNHDTGNIATALKQGACTASLTDANGCMASFTIQVGEDTCYPIIIHNVITPNGDGINDAWVIEGLQVYADNVVSVFDKWGEQVFTAQGYQDNWTGVGTDGRLLPDGTYFYLVKLNAKNGNGADNVFTGAILLKR